MRVVDILQYIDSVAPFALASEWDNPGLLVGDAQAEVTGIVVALDITTQVIAEAEALGCNLLVSHHPVIFAPIKNVLAGGMPYALARRGFSVICAHTNLDLAGGGVNDVLAQELGLVEVEKLCEGDQFGLRGRLPAPMQPVQLAAMLAARLGLAPHYNPCGREITRVGLCGGSGGDMLAAALAEGIELDAFVTADVKHHEFLAAAAAGATLYDAGHYATEAPVMAHLVQQLQLQFPQTRVVLAKGYAGMVVG